MVPENARNQGEIDLMLGKIPFDENQFILCTFCSLVHDLGTMAEFRPNSEIIGKIRKMEKFYGHFVKLQKWLLQTNFERVGVF